MFRPKKILVIDHNADSGALLVRTLMRKFPQAVVQLCQRTKTAAEAATAERMDAIVVHRTEEEDAVTLIEMLRRIDGCIPIIAVSGIDRTDQVIAAGATGFLHYDKWLTIGTVVSEALMAQEGERQAEAGEKDPTG